MSCFILRITTKTMENDTKTISQFDQVTKLLEEIKERSKNINNYIIKEFPSFIDLIDITGRMVSILTYHNISSQDWTDVLKLSEQVHKFIHIQKLTKDVRFYVCRNPQINIAGLLAIIDELLIKLFVQIQSLCKNSTCPDWMTVLFATTNTSFIENNKELFDRFKKSCEEHDITVLKSMTGGDSMQAPNLYENQRPILENGEFPKDWADYCNREQARNLKENKKSVFVLPSTVSIDTVEALNLNENYSTINFTLSSNAPYKDVRKNFRLRPEYREQVNKLVTKMQTTKTMYITTYVDDNDKCILLNDVANSVWKNIKSFKIQSWYNIRSLIHDIELLKEIKINISQIISTTNNKSSGYQEIVEIIDELFGKLLEQIQDLVKQNNLTMMQFVMKICFA